MQEKLFSFLKKSRRILTSANYRYAPLAGLKPNKEGYSYSDLFLWRSSKSWGTNYCLLPYADLIKPEIDRSGGKINRSRIIILSNEGHIIQQKIIENKSFLYKDILIEDLLSKSFNSCEHGTFAVFHESIPTRNELSNGYMSDRGYVGYRYSTNTIWSKVHGNLDAISNSFKEVDFKSCIAMRSSLFKRRLKIQYLFSGNESFELGFTNPTKKKQLVQLKLFDRHKELINILKLVVLPFGSNICSLRGQGQVSTIEIRSKLPFPRPLIFKIGSNSSYDVFHA